MAEPERTEVVMLKGRRASVDGGPAIDLVPLSRQTLPAKMAARFVAAEAAIPVAEIRWPAKTPPAKYLADYPNGKQATVARVLAAHPDLMSEPAGSSEPADSSEET